jgi:hypothetical protein
MDGKIIDTSSAKSCGQLIIHEDHHIDQSHLEYHRQRAQMV